MARLTAFVLTVLVASCAAQLDSYRRQPQRFESQSIQTQRKEFSQSSFNNQPGFGKQFVLNKPSNTAGFEQQAAKPLFNKGSFSHSVFNKAEYKRPVFNQPEVNQPAFNKAEYKRPVFNQPEVDQSAFNKAEFKKPVFNQPEVDQSAFNKAEFKKPVFNQPEVDQSAFNKAEFKKPVFNQPDVDQSAFNKAEYKRPVFNQPEVDQSAFNKVEFKKPVFNQPEVVQSAFSKVEYKKPAFSQSEVSTFALNDDKTVFGQSEVQQSAFSKPEYKKPEFNKPAFTQSSLEQSSVVKTEFVPILKYANDVMPDGTFQYGYESGDGTAEEVRGYMRTLDLPESQPAQVIEGQYSYVGPEGVRYTVTYIADENGFRAKGAHLPVPPPIPVEIQRSLELIKRLQAEQQPDVPVQQSDLFTGVRRPVGLDQIRGRALEEAEDQSEITTITPDIPEI